MMKSASASSPVTPRIFMSYRRADTRTITGRLYDRLEIAFGSENIFKDVDDIPIGHDFRQVLEREISKCDVLLAIIGREWASSTEGQHQRRIDDEDDFVRIEIEAALKREDVLVVPVLVEGATMPSPNDLPGYLRELAFRHAAILRDDPDFRRDVERLIAQIRGFVDQKHRAVPASTTPQTPASPAASQVTINSQVQTAVPTQGQALKWVFLAAGLLAALALIFVVALPRLSEGNTPDIVDNDPTQHDLSGTLMFTSDMGGNNQIWKYDLATTELTTVLDYDSDVHFPVPSPSGDKIAFISDLDGDPALYVYDFDSDETVYMSGSAVFDRPSWSPDGTEIAFSADPHDDAEIFIVDVDSREVWSQEDDEGDDLSPSWNPQGTWIAFSSERSGHPVIYKLNVDTEDDIYQQSYGELADTTPAYSPDGEGFAYRCDGGDHASICLINGQGELDFALPADGFYSWPAWSPDGRLLAVNSEDANGTNILIVNLETRDIFTLELPTGHHATPSWLN